MRIEVDNNPCEKDLEELYSNVLRFNSKHIETEKRFPLAIWCKDENKKNIAGISGVIFGNWLLISFLWVNSKIRGSGIGSELLNKIEETAKSRGCFYVMLNTLDFQAQPFYENRGYKTIFTLANYPLIGKKHFLIKTL